MTQQPDCVVTPSEAGQQRGQRGPVGNSSKAGRPEQMRPRVAATSSQRAVPQQVRDTHRPAVRGGLGPLPLDRQITA